MFRNSRLILVAPFLVLLGCVPTITPPTPAETTKITLCVHSIETVEYAGDSYLKLLGMQPDAQGKVNANGTPSNFSISRELGLQYKATPDLANSDYKGREVEATIYRTTVLTLVPTNRKCTGYIKF